MMGDHPRLIRLAPWVRWVAAGWVVLSLSTAAVPQTGAVPRPPCGNYPDGRQTPALYGSVTITLKVDDTIGAKDGSESLKLQAVRRIQYAVGSTTMSDQMNGTLIQRGDDGSATTRWSRPASSGEVRGMVGGHTGEVSEKSGRICMEINPIGHGDSAMRVTETMVATGEGGSASSGPFKTTLSGSMPNWTDRPVEPLGFMGDLAILPQGFIEAAWSQGTTAGSVTGKLHFARGPLFCAPGDALCASESFPFTGSVTVEWSFTEGKLPEVELTLIPAPDYDKWLPEGGNTETELGNLIDFEVRLHKAGDPQSDSPKKAESFTVELVDTTMEKGVNLNWPRGADKPLYDMKIDPDNPWLSVTGEGQKAQTKERGLSGFRFTINSYDFGGYARVRVKAKLEDGSEIVARLQGTGTTEVPVPRDDNGNKIADAWEERYALPSTDPRDDSDPEPPGDGHDGDALSLYEEYRGFMGFGVPIRGKPLRKELIVYDEDNLGVGYYENSGILTWRVDYTELSVAKSGDRLPRVVNGNAGYATAGPKYAVLLFDRDTGGDAGVTLLAAGDFPTVPRHVRVVNINRQLLLRCCGREGLDSTIAHELGHATHVLHHGDGLDYGVKIARCLGPDGRMAQRAARGAWGVAVQHGNHSGNENCVMRYNQADFFEDPQGACEVEAELEGGKVLIPATPNSVDPWGKRFCTTKLGTGANARHPHNRAGDAKDGRCAHQLCVNDHKH
jgi:hypothetical protein